MRFSAMRSNLVDALTGPVRAVDRKSRLPVLTNVLLSTDDGEVVITGTDLHTMVTTRCPGKIDEDGAVTLPAADLLRIVKGAPKDALVTLSADPEAIAAGSEPNGPRIPVTVTAGSFATYTLSAITAIEYPALSEPGAMTFQIVAHELARILSETIPAASRDTDRVNLTGVNLAVHGRTITAAAADNYRIAFTSGEIIGEAECNMLLPATIAKSLIAMLRGPEVVTVGILNPAQATFTFGDKHGREVIFRAMLIDGHFPNYQQVIPARFGTSANVNRLALLEAMGQADKVSPNHVARLSFEVDALRITAKGWEATDAFATAIPAEVTGVEVTIGVSVNLFSALASIPDEVVRIRTGGTPDEPNVLAPLSIDVPALPGRDDWQLLVMPVRVTS